MTQKNDGKIQGANSMRVCPATMINVVQQWLDTELASAVTVTSVREETNGFLVSFKGADVEAKP